MNTERIDQIRKWTPTPGMGRAILIDKAELLELLDLAQMALNFWERSATPEQAPRPTPKGLPSVEELTALAKKIIMETSGRGCVSDAVAAVRQAILDAIPNALALLEKTQAMEALQKVWREKAELADRMIGECRAASTYNEETLRAALSFTSKQLAKSMKNTEQAIDLMNGYKALADERRIQLADINTAPGLSKDFDAAHTEDAKPHLHPDTLPPTVPFALIATGQKFGCSGFLWTKTSEFGATSDQGAAAEFSPARQVTPLT